VSDDAVLQYVTSRCTARRPLWHATLLDNYRQVSPNKTFPLLKFIRRYVGVDHFCLGLMKTDPLLTKMCAKNDFYIFVPINVDIWPLRLNFSPSYPCQALCFHCIRSFCGFPISRKSEATGRTDRRTACNS